MSIIQTLKGWFTPKPTTQSVRLPDSSGTPSINHSVQRTNEAGIALIKQFEGCKLTAYQDSVGVWTIGWGTTSATGFQVYPGLKITQAKADELLLEHLKTYERGVRENVRVALTDNQFAALVSFSYNVGVGAFKSSTLLKRLNAGKYQEAADQFLRWDKAGGKTLKGLTRRRQAERALFLK